MRVYLYNDICCSMYVINIVVVMTMMFGPRRIGSWLSYEMWDIRSVNMLYVDNLEPPDTLLKFWYKFR
jgi:hypothetical protein